MDKYTPMLSMIRVLYDIKRKNGEDVLYACSNINLKNNKVFHLKLHSVISVRYRIRV